MQPDGAHTRSILCKPPRSVIMRLRYDLLVALLFIEPVVAHGWLCPGAGSLVAERRRGPWLRESRLYHCCSCFSGGLPRWPPRVLSGASASLCNSVCLPDGCCFCVLMRPVFDVCTAHCFAVTLIFCADGLAVFQKLFIADPSLSLNVKYGS